MGPTFTGLVQDPLAEMCIQKTYILEILVLTWWICDWVNLKRYFIFCLFNILW